MPIDLQLKVVCIGFHGECDNQNSIGPVETIVSDAGVSEDMHFCREAGVVNQKTQTKTKPVSLQMKDGCTLDPAKACIVGELVAAEMLHGGTKNVAAPWISGGTLLNQGTEVHRDCNFPDAGGCPCCGADKHCLMPNESPSAGCCDIKKRQKKNTCLKCGQFLHGGICGRGEEKT